MTGAHRPRVVIVQRYITHYRVPFLERLRSLLDESGVELVLVHGFPDVRREGDKQDTVTVPWAHHIRNRWWSVGSRTLVWEPAVAHTRDADLVIVEQASTRLLNYVLYARQLAGRTRLALWGHGRNFKSHRASRLGEAVKRFLSRRVHWWFAYNELAVEVVEDLGFPRERITDVQNAIDTRSLVRERAALTDEDLARFRREHDLPDHHVAAFVGGMYPEKRLGFLVRAAEHLRRQLPDFTLLLIGAGPDADLAREAAARHEWIRYLGPRQGEDKVRWLATAEVLLLPGLVGLAILDTFALEVPLVTVREQAHSPEIAYLEPGANGVMLPEETTPTQYADEIADLLGDTARLRSLREGCRAARDRYTIEEMARRFAEGVLAALATPR